MAIFRIVVLFIDRDEELSFLESEY